MKALKRAVLSFLITLICIMGVVALGYNKLQTNNPEIAVTVDSLIAQIFPESAPGLTYSPDGHKAAKEQGLVVGTSGLTTKNFANEKQGSAYLKWKRPIDNPGKILVQGTNIPESTINAVLAGDKDLASLASGVSKSDLATLGQNARTLRGIADSHKVPDNLPNDTQAYMRSADDSLRALASAAEKASELGLKAQGGDMSQLAKLPSVAREFKTAAKELNKNANKAESSLGAH